MHSRLPLTFDRPARVAAQLVVVTALVTSPLATGSARASAGPQSGPQAESSGAIEGRYIVTFDPSARRAEIAAARDGVRGRGGKVIHDYERAVKGFSATLPADAVTELLEDPDVLAVEPDQVVYASEMIVPTTQFPAIWGLDRIDQAALPLNSAYTYGATGAGVTAYVIDTGIRAGHTEFGGRVAAGFTVIEDEFGTDDCAGHGTHVAGSIGGSTYGVAKAVSLVPVRVLDCDGAGLLSGVIAGVDWVTAHHVGPSVANMSLGGGVSKALDTAVTNSIASGVTYAVAAGNENTSACSTSPARVPGVVTVGASTAADRRASFSNFGRCLDLFAPGEDILSASSTGDFATVVYSGTSMATPHVTGVMATYLQGEPDARPSEVSDAVLEIATAGALTRAGSGSPNSLLRSLPAAAAVPMPGPKPGPKPGPNPKPAPSLLDTLLDPWYPKP